MHTGSPALHDRVYRSAANAGGTPSLGDEIRLVLSVTTGGWKILLAGVASACLLALFYALLSTPLYSATTQMLLEPRQQQIVNSRVVDTSLGSSAVGADLLSLDSQLEVLRSDSVLRQVVDAENLTTDLEFIGRPSPLSGIKDLLGSLLPQRPAGPNDLYDTVLDALRRRMSVARESNTYVISISIKTEDPEKSARLANRFAEIYLASNSSAALASTEQAASALQERLDTLREQANRDNQAVEAYRRDHGLTSTATGTETLLVIDQQLRDLNNQLSLARVAKVDAESNLAQVRQAQASGAGSDNLGAVSLQSEVLNKLQIDLAALQVEESALRARYLPDHPAFATILDRKAALTAAIDAEFSRIIDRFELASQIATDKEATISAQVTELESRSADLDVASVRLRELEREAASSQTVYESYLNRAKEVTEQVGLPINGARMISQAFPPSRPSEPRTMILLLASAVVGFVASLVFVWLRFILKGGEPRHVAQTQIFTPVPAPAATRASDGALARQQILQASGLPGGKEPPRYRNLS